MLFLPHGTPAQMTWYDELLRMTASAGAAVQLFHARGSVDVAATAPMVDARTLVIHAPGDRVVPIEEGRLLAALIPDARLADGQLRTAACDTLPPGTWPARSCARWPPHRAGPAVSRRPDRGPFCSAGRYRLRGS